MIHGPDNPESLCMIDGNCSKDYPKSFPNATVIGEHFYPSIAEQISFRQWLCLIYIICRKDNS